MTTLPAGPRTAPPPPPPVEGRPTALVALLAELAEATDALTIAVERHDLAGLLAANDRAEALTSRVDGLVGALTEADRAGLDRARIVTLRERLEAAARRNAYLIERAWALDAATMRLLAGLGRPDPASAAGAYAVAPGGTWLDRQA